MELYKINIKKDAEKELKSLHKQDLKRIVEKIQSLASNPRPMGCQKLKGDEGYRVRQGDFRVVYHISDAEKIVRIIRIGHRREVYH